MGGQFSRYNHVGKIINFPAAHLGAIAEVEILSKCVPLPATGIFDTGAAPNPCCAIEIEEEVILRADGLFHNKMPIDCHCFHLGQRIVITIRMSPTGLKTSKVFGSK